MSTFEYKGKVYPEYIRHGNAVKYIEQIAKYFCKGSNGLDIGGTSEWCLPEARPINIDNKDGYHAMNLPGADYNYIFSSHALEHVQHPYYTLKYWTEKLLPGGVLFLYLPSVKMEYWTIDNPKHLHYFTPEVIEYWMKDLGYYDIISSQQDMYFSFTVVGRKI